MHPKDMHILIPRTCECYLKWQKGILWMWCELSVLISCLFGQAQCSHWVVINEWGRQECQREPRGGDMVMEAEVRVMWREKDSACCCWLGRWRDGSTSQGMLDRSRKWILPSSLQNEHSPTDILILVQWDPFQTSDLQNCKINLCRFKPLSLW